MVAASKDAHRGTDKSVGGDAAAVPGFTRLGELLAKALPGSPVGAHVDNRRVAEVWRAVMGPEAAANSQPRHLRNGRLVVATYSSAWAQALQDQGDEIVARLNAHLGEGFIAAVSFRPAGWDPCAGADAPRPLEAVPTSWAESSAGSSVEGGRPDEEALSGGSRRPARPLTEEERRSVEEVRRSAVDPDLGELIAAAMKASLEHRGRPEDGAE